MTSFRSELPPDVVTEWIKAFGFKNLRDRRSLQFPAQNPITLDAFNAMMKYYYPSRRPATYDYQSCKKIFRQIIKASEHILLSKEIRIGPLRTHEYSIMPTKQESQDEPTEIWPLGVDPQKDEETTH